MKWLFAIKIFLFSLSLVDSFDSSSVILAIDCGSSFSYRSSLGFTYDPDNYFFSASYTAILNDPISLTQDKAVYQTLRYSRGNLEYRIPVKVNGSYVLILQFSNLGFYADGLTLKIGSYAVKNLKISSEVGYGSAYDIFVKFTLSNSAVYINGSSISDAYSNQSLMIFLVPNKGFALISGIFLVRGDCSTVDNCNMCYGLKCSSCNYPSSLTCSSCIANANLYNGICSCNSNAYYASASNKCVVCDNLCGNCYGSNAFQCNSCSSAYYLIFGVCLKACPYGFSASCSAVSGAVIDTNFANYFNGTYGVFRTGSSGSSYYFFNSPQNDDPIPAKNRGLYFSGGAYLETISTVYFSLSFSVGLWVWISPGSGHIFTHSDSRIAITEAGALKILLENHLESTELIITNNLSPPSSVWVYLSYVVSYSNPATTITTYLNNLYKEIISKPGYIYRDLPGSTITLGKNLASNFKGYIYQFQLWNSAVLNFNTQYFDQLCGTGKISNCLWSCNITSWIDNGIVFPCDESCSTGCSRKDTCNVCDDPLCSTCRGFSNGLCDQCVPNASGTPCNCNSGFVLSESGFSCTAYTDSELSLSENAVYDENLKPSQWKYYKIPFYQGHRDISLFINTEFSNPKICINVNSDNKLPDLNVKNYYFDNFTSKTLKISLTWDSIAYNNCNSELMNHFDPNKQCAYHIAIFSPANTAYSIKFKAYSIKPKLITIGIPIISNMNLYDHKLYNGIIDIDGPSIVKINNLAGRSSLYISFFDYELVGNDLAKWPLPYESTNIFNTTKPFDEITFEEDSLLSMCPSNKCIIEICEICWSGPCKAELQLLNQKYRFMKVNTYYNGTVCLNCFHYYEIPFYFGHKKLKISLTPASTDVGLYVNLNTNNTNPDINTYDYKSEKTVTVPFEITLAYDSIAQENCPKTHEEASLCVYHIGIYGHIQSNYALIYYEYDVSYTLRTDSIQVKPIDLNGHGVYNSLIDTNYNAKIIVDELTFGKMNVNIYDYGVLKNDMNFFLHNDTVKANFIVEKKSDIIIMKSDSLTSWCPSKLCLAQICLYCSAKICYPKLQLIQDNEETIEKEKIYNCQVEESAFKDYKIPFSYGHKSVHIVFEVYKGDAEIYISLNDYNERPTLEFYDYKPNLNLSKAEITLVNDEIASINCLQFDGSAVHESDGSCYYHIGIFGKKTSVFSLQVSSYSLMPTELLSNTVQSQKGINTAEDRFFNVMNTEESVSVSIEIISGEALLYISLFDLDKIGRDTTSWPLPNEAEMQYKSQPEYCEETLIEKYVLQETCPSGSCIALLCGFCLSEACEYQLEVKQKLVGDQEKLLFSGNQLGILLFCVFIGFVRFWYYKCKKQRLISRDLENLSEFLIAEKLESAIEGKNSYSAKE